MDTPQEEIGSNDAATSTFPAPSNVSASQRKRVSPVLAYFTKDASGDYYCNTCKKSTPSKEVTIRRDKTGSTANLWKHLERHHSSIFVELKPPGTKNPVTKYFSSERKYIGRTPEQTKERCISLIIKTVTPFSALEDKEYEEFASYFAQCDISLPSANTLRRCLSTKFDNEKLNMRELFHQVEKVSLTMDSWTTTNNIAMLGVTIHWIDDTWTLRERVLAIEELGESHAGAHMAEVLYGVLVEYNLTSKICAITADNASNNNTMAAKLEKLLKGSGSRFTKDYLTPCMAHVLNISVQGGLKELGNTEQYPDNEDDEEPEEASSERKFGEILLRLRKLVVAIDRSPKRIHQYKSLCEEYDMPNQNLLVEDTCTRWNSTCDMIEAAWEKREVLMAMATEHLNSNKADFSIEEDEWMVLKMFSDELLAFREATDVFCKSKSISSSNVSGLYGLLVGQLNSLIFELDHPIEDSLAPKMSNDHSIVLKDAYSVMKEKLIKYEPRVRRKPMFPIATVLDPRFKLGDIPIDEHKFVMETLLGLLESVHYVEASITSPDDLLIAPGGKRSKVMSQFLKGSANSRAIEGENLAKIELQEYLREPCIDRSHDNSLKWWCKTGSHKYPRLAMLAKEFLSICASSSPCERLFSTGRGIVTYKRARLVGETISSLMTLKSWHREDANPTNGVDPDVIMVK